MSRPTPTLHVDPFSIRVPEEVLSDLRLRIRKTRWPDEVPGGPWKQGTGLDYLRQLLAYWADEFDWRSQERQLNVFDQFRAELDGVRIHFVHMRARRRRGIPLILTHGWPSTFVEMLTLVPFLTDPDAYAISGPAFDVVIPSLPGYGFSERPLRTGVTTRYTAGLWHRLMHGLGYERYGAYGTDFGSAVATFMALDNPDPMRGLHLSNVDIQPYTGPGSRALSEAERLYVEQTRRWDSVERGYSAIQSTRPQTLGYGLNDSPAGLAAWILEKWRSWSDSRGDLATRFSSDFLLTTVTLYWATQTITSSIRDYYDNRWSGVTVGPDDFVDVPTAIAVFASNFVSEGVLPREWAERLYSVRRWTPMPSGGHFAAVEEPELLARDIGSFFAEL
jgi:pimeloyl-ACP methyl ester carboxylesterase